MTGDSSSDLLTEYVTLLREFGLPPADIRDLHADEEVDEDAPLEEFVARRVDASSPEALFSRLVETLTQSRRGISATASYWNYAPEVHLDEVFEPFGCSVTFRDAAHGGGNASVEIELEDAGGSGHTIRFEYPDTPLGDDNLPALLHAVERELLASTDLTFVLLAPIDRRWRVVLIESDRLSELERRHGERVEFAGRPLVREEQPPAFASGEAAEVFPAAGETEPGTGRAGASAIARERAADAADLLAGDGGTATIDAGETTADPDAVLDAGVDDAFPDQTAPQPGATGSDVEASDQELKQVFGDLSDVSLEPTPAAAESREVRADDPPVLELGSGSDAAPDAAGDDAGDEPDALDGLFDELERAAITGSDGAGRPAGEGAALVVGRSGGGAVAADAERARTRSAGAPADAADSERSDAGGQADLRDRSLEELLAEVEASDAVEEPSSDDGATSDAEATSAADSVGDDGNSAADEFRWLSEQELAERD